MNEQNKRTIGQVLREIRESKGLSQIKLAEMLGISYQQIQKYEKGTSSISVERLIQIAKALDVSINLFFSSERALVLETASDYGGLSKDERLLVTLFRKIKNKKLQCAYLDFLRIMSKSY